MKKVLSVLVLLILSIFATACTDPHVGYLGNTIKINIDETYTIEESNIVIKESKSDYEIIIIDTDVATIDGLTITPKKEGRTVARIQLVDNDSFYFDIPLIITDITYATDVTVENTEIFINISENSTAFNELNTNEGCNEIPTVQYDQNVITYDYTTGLITAKKPGETQVSVMFKNCTVEFSITIIDTIYVREIDIEDKCLYVGESGTFDFLIFPENANTYYFESNSEIIDISKNGDYVAKSAGNVDVVVKFQSEEGGIWRDEIFAVTILEIPTELHSKITNIQGEAMRYCFAEDEYILAIPKLTRVKNDDFEFSNINVLGSLSDDNYYKFRFKFITDEDYVNIKLNGVIQVENMLEIDVHSMSEIEPVVRLGIYVQNKSQDGNYYVYSNEESLKLSLQVGNFSLDQDVKIYMNSDEDCVVSSFTPDSVGIYNFTFKFRADIIETITIVVVDNN